MRKGLVVSALPGLTSINRQRRRGHWVSAHSSAVRGERQGQDQRLDRLAEDRPARQRTTKRKWSQALYLHTRAIQHAQMVRGQTLYRAPLMPLRMRCFQRK